MSEENEEFLDLSLVGEHFRSGPGNAVLEELPLILSDLFTVKND